MLKRILIIDDDEEMCEEIADLISAEQYRVDIVFSSKAGQKLLKINKYSLVILDLRLPDISGIDMLAFIKKSYKLKVIVITGRPLVRPVSGKGRIVENVKIEELKLADAVINKPFDVDFLLKKVNQLILSS